jgi:outer membrane protein assembly factor BamB
MMAAPVTMRMNLPLRFIAAVPAAFLACASGPASGPDLAPRPIFPLVEESRIDFEGTLLGGPQALGGDVVLSIASGRVLAVSPSQKKVLWQFAAKAALPVPALAGAGFIVVFDQGGRMTRLSGEGKVVWEITVGGAVSFAPSLTSGGIMAVFDRRTIRAFDPATGGEKWSWTADEDVRTAARAWGDKTVILTAAKKAVLLSAAGKPVPLFETAAPASGPLLVSGDRMFAGFENGTLESWDLSAKKKRWTVKTGAALAADPVAGESRIYAVTEGRQLFAIEKRSGVVAWWASLPGRAVGEAVLCEPRVLAPSLTSILTAFDLASGKKAETNDLKQEIVAAPLVLGDRVAVAVRDPATSKGTLVFLKNKPLPPEPKK